MYVTIIVDSQNTSNSVMIAHGPYPHRETKVHPDPQAEMVSLGREVCVHKLFFVM